MTVVSFLFSLFQAIAGVKALAQYAAEFGRLVMTWYIQGQEQKTLQMIADAAALGARAKTEDERYVAALKWKEALSRPRVSL